MQMIKIRKNRDLLVSYLTLKTPQAKIRNQQVAGSNPVIGSIESMALQDGGDFYFLLVK
jgi:hypothetical protein